jgi:hypothetical protein
LRETRDCGIFVSIQVNRQQSTFRVNFQVIQMTGILLVALAVPLTLVTLGIRQFTSKPKISAPETQGLRAALEQAAEKSWQAPGAISDGRSVFAISASGSASDARKAVEQAAQSLQGVVLPASTAEDGAERILVQIPAANASAFEERALRDFSQTQRGNAQGNTRLYELILSPP